MTRKEKILKAAALNNNKKGLVCLVPIDGAECLLTCHEKTLCDCQVLKIIDKSETLITHLADRVEKLEAALEFYAQLKFSTEYFYKDTGEYLYNVVAFPKIDTEARQTLTAPNPLDECLKILGVE